MSTYYTQVRRRVPIVSLVILALNILGFVYELVVGENAAIYRFAMYQGALQDGGWYRLITSAFLHFISWYTFDKLFKSCPVIIEKR